jgi:hypothetical protein
MRMPGMSLMNCVVLAFLDRCLRQWQQALWAQGQFSRITRCDLCCQSYQTQQQFDPSADASVWDRLKQHWVQLQSSPEWALRAWRWCILLGGLVSACLVESGTQAAAHGMSSRHPQCHVPRSCISALFHMPGQLWQRLGTVSADRAAWAARLCAGPCMALQYACCGALPPNDSVHSMAVRLNIKLVFERYSALSSVPCPLPTGRWHTPWCFWLQCWAQSGAAHGTACGQLDLQANAAAECCSSSTALPGTYAAQCTQVQLLPDAAGGQHCCSSRAVWWRAGGVLPGHSWGGEAQCKVWLPGSSCCS